MNGIVALPPEFQWVNDGIDRADSYCTNPHKWMG
jgi:aromatic-L-amino-acid decarboxylase